MTDIVRRTGRESPALYTQRPPEPRIFERDEPLDVRNVVARLLKRRFQILAVAFIVLIPAAVATYLASPMYRSVALIQINSDPVQVLPYRDVADFPSFAPTYDLYMKTQEQLLMSPTLLSQVARRLGALPKTDSACQEARYLQKRFEVQRIENSQLFRVSYVAPDPQVAADVVNLFAEEYIKQHFQARQATRERARQALERELERLEGRLQSSEKELVRYARDNRMLSVDAGAADLVQQKLGMLDKQATDVEAELVVAKSRVETLNKTSIENFPERLLTPGITGLTAQLLQLQHELTAMRTSFGENWPAVVTKKREIVLVEEQLKQQKSAALAQAIEQAQLDLKAAESRYRMISASLAQQEQLVNQFQNASIQYNILKREVETSQKLYEGLLERLKQTSVTAGMEFGNIQVVEPGRPDKTVDSPKVWWNLGLASLLGLALGVCYAFLADFWDNTISTMEEVEQFAALPALGGVPLVKSPKSNGPLLTAGKKDKNRGGSETSLLRLSATSLHNRMRLPAEAAEAVRNVCASILLSKSDRPPRVIMITSATPAEGKTTLAIHMGRTFADSGSRTLLVESDLRKPQLSKAFGLGVDGGLSLFLSGHIPCLPEIHETDSPNLYVVAAGPAPPNPAALLNSEKLSLFLRDAASTFQFILLDAPPLLAFADARVLGPKVDGVVLVVRAGRTPKSLIQRAWMQLEDSGANVLGMVLNGAASSELRYSYYHYYYKQ